MTDSHPPRRLLDRVRDTIRARHMSPRTERAYAGWIRRFIRMQGLRHPDTLDEPQVAAFLVSLSRDGTLSASTVNQARGALV